MAALQLICCFLFVTGAISEIREHACENNNLTISCYDTPDTTLHILWANYGRTSYDYCFQKGHTSTNCAACNSSSIVAGLCQYEVSCTINASNTVFGDPCHGVYKYLEVGYECREPGMQTYECYDWTHEDIAHFWINCTYDSQLEEAACVDHPGYIFTEGNETLAPGCGSCFCCKPTVTQNYECHHWTYSDKVKFLVNCTHHPRLERPTCESYPGYIYTRGDNTLAPGCCSCSCCKPTDTYSFVCPDNVSSTSLISTSSAAATTSTFNRTSPTASVSFFTSLSTTLVTTKSASYPPSSENKISSSTVASPWNTLSSGHSSSPSTMTTTSTDASNALTAIASSHSSSPTNNTSSSTGTSAPTTTIISSHLSSPNNMITSSTATSTLISSSHSSSPSNMLTETSNSIVTVSSRHSSSLRNIIKSSAVASTQETTLSSNYPSTTENDITSSIATTSFSHTSSSKYIIPSSIVAPSQVPMTKGDFPDFFNDPTNITVVSTAAGVAGFLAIFVTVYILVRQRSKIKYLCTKGNNLRHSIGVANR